MRYYLEINASDDGTVLVHKQTCFRLPKAGSRLPIGDFPACEPAVTFARLDHPNANGCRTCLKRCSETAVADGLHPVRKSAGRA